MAQKSSSDGANSPIAWVIYVVVGFAAIIIGILLYALRVPTSPFQ